jgi:hypothetical protein
MHSPSYDDICLVRLALVAEIYEMDLANRGRFDKGLVRKGKKGRAAVLRLSKAKKGAHPFRSPHVMSSYF